MSAPITLRSQPRLASLGIIFGSISLAALIGAASLFEFHMFTVVVAAAMCLSVASGLFAFHRCLAGVVYILDNEGIEVRTATGKVDKWIEYQHITSVQWYQRGVLVQYNSDGQRKKVSLHLGEQTADLYRYWADTKPAFLKQINDVTLNALRISRGSGCNLE